MQRRSDFTMHLRDGIWHCGWLALPARVKEAKQSTRTQRAHRQDQAGRRLIYTGLRGAAQAPRRLSVFFPRMTLGCWIKSTRSCRDARAHSRLLPLKSWRIIITQPCGGDALRCILCGGCCSCSVRFRDQSTTSRPSARFDPAKSRRHR